MTDDRRFDRTARTWLEAGPTRAPDRVVLAALRTIGSTPQERDLRIPRRFPPMTILRFAAVVAVVAVVGGAGILLFGGRSPSPIGGLPTATPSAGSPAPSSIAPSPTATAQSSASPSASPSASQGASAQDPSGTLAVGSTYHVTDASFSQPLTFTVGPGFPATTPAFSRIRGRIAIPSGSSRTGTTP